MYMEWEYLGEKKDKELVNRLEIFADKNVHMFSRNLFDRKYRDKGGINKLNELMREYLKRKIPMQNICDQFNLSKQRVSDISKSYKAKKFAD